MTPEQRLSRVLAKYPQGGDFPVRVAVVDGNIPANHPAVIKELTQPGTGPDASPGHANTVADIIAGICPRVEIVDCVSNWGQYSGLDLAYQAVTQEGCRLVNESGSRESGAGLNIVGDAMLANEAAWVAPSVAGGPVNFDNPHSKWSGAFFIANARGASPVPYGHNIANPIPSWACAMLTGYIALMFSFDPHVSLDEIDEILRLTATDKGSGVKEVAIDLAIEALLAESLDATPTPTPTPTPEPEPDPAPEPTDWKSLYLAASQELAELKAKQLQSVDTVIHFADGRTKHLTERFET